MVRGTNLKDYGSGYIGPERKGSSGQNSESKKLFEITWWG